MPLCRSPFTFPSASASPAPAPPPPAQERAFLLVVLLQSIGLTVMGFVYATVSTSAPVYNLSTPSDVNSPWATCAGLGYNATAADGAAVPPSPAELRLAGSFLFVLLNAVSVFSLLSARQALPKENWLAVGAVPLANFIILLTDFSAYVHGASIGPAGARMLPSSLSVFSQSQYALCVLSGTQRTDCFRIAFCGAQGSFDPPSQLYTLRLTSQAVMVGAMSTLAVLAARGAFGVPGFGWRSFARIAPRGYTLPLYTALHTAGALVRWSAFLALLEAVACICIYFPPPAARARWRPRHTADEAAHLAIYAVSLPLRWLALLLLHLHLSRAGEQTKWEAIGYRKMAMRYFPLELEPSNTAGASAAETEAEEGTARPAQALNVAPEAAEAAARWMAGSPAKEPPAPVQHRTLRARLARWRPRRLYILYALMVVLWLVQLSLFCLRTAHVAQGKMPLIEILMALGVLDVVAAGLLLASLLRLRTTWGAGAAEMLDWLSKERAPPPPLELPANVLKLAAQRRAETKGLTEASLQYVRRGAMVEMIRGGRAGSATRTQRLFQVSGGGKFFCSEELGPRRGGGDFEKAGGHGGLK